MKYKKEEYKLGKYTTIHGHIHNPNWLITNKKLGIMGVQLCPKTYEYWQIVASAKDFLEDRQKSLNAFFNEAIKASSEEVLKV